MAVNELDRDYLRLIHLADQIDNVVADLLDRGETEGERKANVGNVVQMLEQELLDSKYADAGKDLTSINASIAAGRAFWKS